MRMKNDRFGKLLPLLALVILLAGCESDYTEEALQKARAYTLENTRMLPEVSRKYIRFATPELQTTVIFSHYPMRLTEYDHISRNIDFNPRSDPGSASILSQFVWNPPDLGYSVIVIGQSQADMSSWRPLRVVLKDIAPYRKDYENARAAAVSYVTNNMLYLSNLERVRVRTSEAEVRETEFDLEYMFEEQLESTTSEWANFLQTLREQRQRKQYSLIWKTDDGKRRIVITGLASKYSLNGWSPSCGMVIPLAKLDQYTVKPEENQPGKAVSAPELPKADPEKGKEDQPGKTVPAKGAGK